MANRSKGLFVVAVFLAVVIGARHANAGNTAPHNVVFLRMSTCCEPVAWPAAEEAFVAELKTLNISLTVAPAPFDAAGMQAYSRIANQYNADIVVRFRSTPEGALQLDVVRWAHGKADETRKVLFNGSRTPEDLETLLLAGIEAVRSVIISWEPRGAAPPKKPPPEATPKRRVKSAGVGSGGVLGPGGMGPAVGFAWSFTLAPVDALLLEIGGLWTPLGGRVKNRDANASYDALLTRGFVYGQLRLHDRFTIALGAGGGVAVVWMARAVDKDVDKVAYLGGAARLRVAVSSNVGMVLFTTGGVLLPRIQVMLDNATMATWGRPVIDGGLMLDICF